MFLPPLSLPLSLSLSASVSVSVSVSLSLYLSLSLSLDPVLGASGELLEWFWECRVWSDGMKLVGVYVA